jgi:hypothetical protein
LTREAFSWKPFESPGHPLHRNHPHVNTELVVATEELPEKFS